MTLLTVFQVVTAVLILGIALLAIMTAGIIVAEKIVKWKEKNDEIRR